MAAAVQGAAAALPSSQLILASFGYLRMRQTSHPQAVLPTSDAMPSEVLLSHAVQPLWARHDGVWGGLQPTRTCVLPWRTIALSGAGRPSSLKLCIKPGLMSGVSKSGGSQGVCSL
uniref:Uncharacterized protein n=1 Tax=Chlamydomonas euryale TaxID=1486919 RepID=A0A7R9V814_9CHLO